MPPLFDDLWIWCGRLVACRDAGGTARVSLGAGVVLQLPAGAEDELHDADVTARAPGEKAYYRNEVRRLRLGMRARVSDQAPAVAPRSRHLRWPERLDHIGLCGHAFLELRKRGVFDLGAGRDATGE